MRSAFKGLVVLCGVALLSGSARGDTPNFNKRGSTDKEEKEFVTDVAQTIVKAARSSAKDITLQEYKFKDPKEGHKQLTISAGYKGDVLGKKYTADIVVHIDSSTKDDWKVLKVDYKDNNKSLVKFGSKDVEGLVKKFNSAARK
jgi:phenylpyruvate tautomerase PptA (4-oxalocrotonate tautomerase family)